MSVALGLAAVDWSYKLFTTVQSGRALYDYATRKKPLSTTEKVHAAVTIATLPFLTARCVGSERLKSIGIDYTTETLEHLFHISMGVNLSTSQVVRIMEKDMVWSWDDCIIVAIGIGITIERLMLLDESQLPWLRNQLKAFVQKGGSMNVGNSVLIIKAFVNRGAPNLLNFANYCRSYFSSSGGNGTSKSDFEDFASNERAAKGFNKDVRAKEAYINKRFAELDEEFKTKIPKIVEELFVKTYKCLVCPITKKAIRFPSKLKGNDDSIYEKAALENSIRTSPDPIPGDTHSKRDLTDVVSTGALIETLRKQVENNWETAKMGHLMILLLKEYSQRQSQKK